MEEVPGPGSDGAGPATAATYERRIVTILFADLVGFTTLSETLDPEDVAAVQDRYFATVRDTIGRYGGVLEKFIGDAAMAAFGIPRARDDDAERAVRAGLALASAVEHLAGPLGLEPGALAVRVGITTGEVAHATSGQDQGRLSGDSVNTAARLQAAAPVGRVLLGETTALAVAEAIELESLEPITVKGRAEPVRVALALGARAVRSRDAAMGGLRAPTLGRAAELDRLVAAATATHADGANQTWLIVAPPGVGKSRLLGDLAVRLDVALPDRVALATARFRAGDGRPFGALGDLAGAILGGRSAGEIADVLRASGMSAGRADVIREHALRLLAPEPWTERGSGPWSGPGHALARADAADRDALFDAWLAGFDALASVGGRRSMVWLLEDVHWAGRDAMVFIERAHATPAGSGRLIVATARPSLFEAEPHWADVDGTDGRHRMDLGALPSAAAADLVRALVGDALPAELNERVAVASDGNPLFIEELLRTWVSVGLLVRNGDGVGTGTEWRLTAAAPDVPVAPTVQAIYQAQLDDLPVGARRLARQGSVAGRRVPGAFLGAVGAGDGESAAAVASLVQRALFAGPADDPPLGDSYAYRHALLRDAGYASLARSERASLHVRFARWVEELLGNQPSVGAEWIGDHLEAAIAEAPALAAEIAPGLDRATASILAAEWLEQAAESAVRRSARDRAVDLWRRALALTPSSVPLDAARRARRLGETIADSGGFDEAAEHLSSALDRYRACLADAAEDPTARSAAREGLAGTADSLGRVLLEQVRFEACWTLAEAVLAEIGPADDLPSTRLRLRAAIGHTHFSDDDEDLRPAARAAVVVAEREGDRELELDARLALLSTVLDPAEIESDGLAVGALATGLGRPDVLSRVWRIRAMTMAETDGDPYPLLDQAAEIATSHGLDEALGWASYARSEISLGRGLWDLAVDAGLRAIELGERHGYDRIVVRTWHVLGPIAAAREDRAMLRRAAAWYGPAEAFLPDSPYGRLQSAGMHGLFGRLGIEPPRDPDPALLRPSFDQDVGLTSGLEALDEVLRRWIGDGRLDVVDEAVRHLRVAVARATTPLGRAGLALFEGRLALAQADAAGAALSARAALAAASEVDARWWRARALRLLDRAGAATPAERAEAAAIEHDLGLPHPAS